VNIKKNLRGVVAVFEADQQTYYDVVSAGRAYISWGSCRVNQYIKITDCCAMLKHMTLMTVLLRKVLNYLHFIETLKRGIEVAVFNVQFI
jgi:hypothetical protein